MKHTVADQQSFWNDLHAVGKHTKYEGKPSSFAREVMPCISRKSTLLELGCGIGNDSFYFSKNVEKVVGTDFAVSAIEQNRKKYNAQQNLTFQVLDMTDSFPFENEIFDVVYAHLSLHYFTDSETKRIFAEIHRILRPHGLFYFICKSTDDPLYGKGHKIEKDMYEENGHVRHFFSETYTKECIQDLFTLQKIESGTEDFYEKASAYVKVQAQKGSTSSAVSAAS